ncbi:MAG: PilZ domain-containing protein [Phycisphaerales bacterium]|nr:PilZ domain-containing protein [Phycisphaerae bacterium]NNF44351.1 PilZ domain-containing protein [Phycisphaerales bacterium]NNM27719.1 PilZ domain-containing protein [Phycisphaerales bacterium]
MTDPNNPIDAIIDIARGASDLEPTDVEQRNTRRVDHVSPVGFVQWTPTGGKSIPTVVSCKNISSSGMCVISRFMLHVGHEGAVLMRRSNGEEVLLGVRVVHCSYVGDMKHESGLTFIEVPENFSIEDFRDEHGNMPQLQIAA